MNSHTTTYKTLEEEVQDIIQEAVIAGQRNPEWIGTEVLMGLSEKLITSFSQLTEQMIPEEMSYDMSIFDKPTSAAKVVVDLNKQFLKEMRRRRAKLLNK